MIKNISAIVFLFLITSCSEKITEAQLSGLNGYWEIEKVTLSDGQKKEYKVNETIDYIQLDGLKGFRKKMKPNFSGTYTTSDDAETFTIFHTGDSYLLTYKTAISEWTETLKSISKDQFSVTSEDNITYFYKRYEPINISK
ncbi:hypothetical protein Celal_2762 [Cellulophaga algicola DSM 14237]|uniref:Lipocalin-like domain-containing protein n=1 Tax=Cellulophaga algicola (strain DSM 14237 / IC166 / ACAM 630) TaxID=688270 RepID=E6XC39_CELAD|nr:MULTISPECIES: hypothetical protein [Cellulophaga]ADV50044.1 hypothetical protein Celal_2762 [Cellulophaga algicola DSM 14237]